MYFASQSSLDSYYALAKQGQVWVAHASYTGPTAYSTAATVGLLLYNGSGLTGNTSRVMAVPIGLAIGWTTAPSATGTMGLTWGATTAPASTSAITAVGNALPSITASPACNTYSAGTVSTAGAVFLATHVVSTAGSASMDVFQALDGMVQAGPGQYISVVGAAAISTMVAKVSLVWAEIPL